MIQLIQEELFFDLRTSWYSLSLLPICLSVVFSKTLRPLHILVPCGNSTLTDNRAGCQDCYQQIIIFFETFLTI